jgi:hypothetical protein
MRNLPNANLSHSEDFSGFGKKNTVKNAYKSPGDIRSVEMDAETQTGVQGEAVFADL